MTHHDPLRSSPPTSRSLRSQEWHELPPGAPSQTTKGRHGHAEPELCTQGSGARPWHASSTCLQPDEAMCLNCHYWNVKWYGSFCVWNLRHWACLLRDVFSQLEPGHGSHLAFTRDNDTPRGCCNYDTGETWNLEQWHEEGHPSPRPGLLTVRGLSEKEITCLFEPLFTPFCFSRSLYPNVIAFIKKTKWPQSIPKFLSFYHELFNLIKCFFYIMIILWFYSFNLLAGSVA